MRNTILKLRTIIAIAALIILSACSSHSLHTNVGGLETPIYPVIQF